MRLLERRGCTLEVADLDVLDQTPLLDVKPYVPRCDAWNGRAGWVDDGPAPTTGASGATRGSRG